MRLVIRSPALALLVSVIFSVAVASGSENSAAGARSGEVTTIKIRPSQTDPEIRTFDTPHHVFVNEAILQRPSGKTPEARRQLLLWIPGTQKNGGGDGPGGAAGFCKLAATLGYHVIVLKYPNDESASICRQDSDPAAFEKFRMTLIAGGSSKHVTLARAESIENRLIKLLGHLVKARPDDHWEQFLEVDGSIKWATIAVAGQSQGGGHAALIGIKHEVARVICLGAPKDNSLALKRPATWLTEESATPKGRFFSFNHQQDHQGCSPTQQMENLRALKLDEFGKPVDVDHVSPPYKQSRILTTNYPGEKIPSGEAHTSVISPRNEAVFGDVWTYMLTAPVP